METMVVLVENMCVGGTLKTFSKRHSIPISMMGLLTNHLKPNPHFLDPKVFLDRGRQMPEGPPLLKERRYLRKDAAEQM